MVIALTEALRQELRQTNSNIRISSISPTLVKTECLLNSGISEEAVRLLYNQYPSLEADDITETLIHVLSAPPHVQVNTCFVVPSPPLHDSGPRTLTRTL
ncbi:dehydrogenase/reductase SDR family member 11-like [Portunus trituberculatus]|uniref:dehydrogenase/reductase SDR family member 11-like n=1 Tax=Portunus trituberculatus TaxID=210409 RepID=UPI001E1CDA1B|nr:dehydrogenase/reductase SDR family member 11-like [Portunus trituberculatus]